MFLNNIITRLLFLFAISFFDSRGIAYGFFLRKRIKLSRCLAGLFADVRYGIQGRFILAVLKYFKVGREIAAQGVGLKFRSQNDFNQSIDPSFSGLLESNQLPFSYFFTQNSFCLF